MATDATDPAISNTGSGAIASRGGIAAGAKGIAAGRDVHVHHHAASEEPVLRPTSPAPPAHFTGHQDDLDRFTQLLTSGQNVAITALHGMGGIGKTSLALKLAEQLHPHFPGGVLWWSLGPTPDVVTALDVWARHANPHADLSTFSTAEARSEVVRSMLAKLDKLCILIDDVWDAGSFGILKNAIPPGCPIVITTRDGDLAKSLRCRVERIDALKDKEAIEMLVKLLGPLNGWENAARDIVHLTDGLPLALELIAGIADSPADLPAIAAQLRTKPPLDVLQRGETREQSIEVCFTMSYARLNADLRRRFRALGVFALAAFDRDALAAVWDDGNSDMADKAVQLLVRRSLLSRLIPSAADTTQNSTPSSSGDGSERIAYGQHALLRDYAMKLLAASRSSLPAVSGEEAAGIESACFTSRHAAHYLRFAQEQDWHAIERAFEQIEQGWRWVQAHEPGQIVPYVFAIRRFLDMRGRKRELLKWLEAALAQARLVRDRGNEGTILNNLGGVYHDLGQKEQALDFYRQALDISREVGNRGGEGITLNNLGCVYDDLGQKEKALDFYRQALDIHREVDNRGGEGTILNNLGRVYDALGQKDKTLGFYRQALDIWREVGDRGGEGTTLNNLGRVYDALGQKDKALDFYRQTLDIRREVGDRGGEGITLNNLGGVYHALGQKEQALDFYRQALDISREVGDRDGEGTTLNNLGGIHNALDQKDKALDFYRQALDIRREVGDRGGEGVTLNNLGRVCNALGQKDKALDFYRQALDIWCEVGDRYGEGVTLWNMGALFELMDNLEEAESVLKKAVGALHGCGSPDATVAQQWLDRVQAKLQ
jgi:tetratricopeptide (TPR) repeat protein